MKDILRVTTFGILVVFIMAALSAFFNGGFWYRNGYVSNRDARYAAIDLEEPGQIDVLNVGDSLCDVSLTPLELFRDYGITSYNMGRDLQSKEATYYAIKAALRKQKIKVLLWETDNLCMQQDDITSCMHELSEFNYYHFPVLRYHSFWKNWMNSTKRGEFYKGYQIQTGNRGPDLEKNTDQSSDQKCELESSPGQSSDQECDLESSDWSGNQEHAPDQSWSQKRELERAEKLRTKIELNKQLTFERNQMKAFKRIYNLCKANNIKLVLYSAPSMKYYRSRKRHDALAKLAAQYGIDYIDGNYDEMAIGIDWNKDSYDGGAHLNLYGSRKMTKYLGEYLTKQCVLTDHRGDPTYSSWEDMRKYESECGE